MATPPAKPTPVRPVPPPMNAPRPAGAPAPAAKEGGKKPVAPWRPKLGKAVPWLAAAYLVGLAVQVLLAGYGVTELGGEGMGPHIGFAHVIELLPPLILIVGFVGADKRAGVTGIVLLVLFQLQYVFIALEPPAVRALHAANAAVMVAATTWLLLRRPLWRRSAA